MKRDYFAKEKPWSALLVCEALLFLSGTAFECWRDDAR